MTFTALVVDRSEDGAISQTVKDLPDTALPDGDVTVAVEYSTVNYKDGLCITGQGGQVRVNPHVPGIDLAGTVETSADSRYRPGDRVILTGWRVGEAHWGGYAAKARVKADWLVPLPKALTARQAMAVGTAGLTAVLALQALEAHGLTPDKGEVLVTGAAGGVGSVAVALLANEGYQVAAVTGRPETESYLKGLGASRIIPRAELAETVKRPLETETWAGCIDAVGGSMLARVLGADEIWRVGCCRGPCRRNGAARNGHSLPAARREPAGHRFGDAAFCKPRSGMEPGCLRASDAEA